MLVGHLIGGNEIVGIREGIVIINDEQLKVSYEDLVAVCGQIALGDLDTRKSEEAIERDYIKLIREHDDEIGEDFVIDNHLAKEVSCSSYEIDFEKRTLTLMIETYE
ncbi:hypothetical protein OCA22_23995 [Bacillus cereus]|nr:hypothetical protein [Bacillus cereus]